MRVFKHEPSVEWVRGSVILTNGTHWKKTMNLIDQYVEQSLSVAEYMCYWALTLW